MGLEDSIREAERAKAAGDDARSRTARAAEDRQAKADELLKILGAETLLMVQKRKCPRALEIKAVSTTTGVFKTKTRVDVGRILWLLTPAHVYGESLNTKWGVLETGKIVAVHDLGFSSQPAHEGMHRQAIKEAVHRASCSAAVQYVSEYQAHVGRNYSERSAQFWLDDSDILMWGYLGSSETAENAIAKMLI